MKKYLLLAFALTSLVGSAFCQTTDSKKGYFKLPWGATVEEAQKAGYKLTKVQETSAAYNDMWLEPVELYGVKPKDSVAKDVSFTYYKGKLFLVSETVSLGNSQSKIESRYGSFSKNGIRKFGEAYSDEVKNEKGKIQALSILISPKRSSSLNVMMLDWNVFGKINKDMRKFYSGDSNDLVAAFETLAKKLVANDGGKVASYAIMKFSSDFDNAKYDDYITDILTEAIFNTGSVKIIERANLEKIIKEQKLQNSGLINESTAKAVGMVSGADYVCYGSIKDVGTKFTISARVVDVETGEICAMSRDTIEKDEYLINATSSTANSKKAANSTSSKRPASSLWTCVKSRNEFDGYTTYTFILKGPEEEKLFLGYDKNDIPSKSKVRAGVSWGKIYVHGNYDFKTEKNGTISKKYQTASWSLDTGWKDGSNQIKFCYNQTESARFFINLFENNDYLTVRHNDAVRRFQTQGFWETVEANGITKKEISDAIKNEEF